jgi:hypothetical protein
MTDSDIVSTEHARGFLLSLGFAVEDIPTAPRQRTADLRAFIEGEEYVVEAKFRKPHREWLAALERAEISGFATTSREIAPWFVVANRVADGHEQLVATSASAAAFRILWIVALHPDDHFVILCFERQLLGVRQVFAYKTEDFSVSAAPLGKLLDCYYFEENDFERYREIDAAVLWDQEGGKLLLNHFSANRERFRRSRLHDAFRENGAVVDADILTRSGQALMLDADFRGPHGDGAQQTYLRERHNVLVNLVSGSNLHIIGFVPPT